MLSLQYLTLHLTQRGALWASGAAQAAHVVRIILAWMGRRECQARRCVRLRVLASVLRSLAKTGLLAFVRDCGQSRTQDS